MSKNIEEARASWAEIAKANGWHTEPFFVQVWLDRKGEISDSVSFGGMTSDIILKWEMPEWCETCGCDFEAEEEFCKVCGDEVK